MNKMFATAFAESAWERTHLACLASYMQGTLEACAPRNCFYFLLPALLHGVFPSHI